MNPAVRRVIETVCYSVNQVLVKEKSTGVEAAKW
jgi:hypothetical protein